MSKYDLIIAGGGTAGVSCAYIAAKMGLKVLLIEQNSFLGGSLTASLVVPAMKTSDNAINSDFFNELHNNLLEIGGAITYCDGNKGWFNPELVKIALDKMMIEANVDVLFESNIKQINIQNNKILSVYIETLNGNNMSLKNNGLLLPIETTYFVDATGDAKIFQMLNCEFLNNNFEKQPTSLRFIMSGVNVEAFASWIMQLDTDRDVTTACTLGGYTYCSTAYTWDTDRNWALKPIVDQAIADNTITTEDINYFQLFSVAGTPDSIAFNAPRLLRNEGYIEGRARILRLSNFCKKYLPGFEKAYISSIANTMGIRVSNRIKGKYTYTIEDLLSSKTFNNPVVVSNYPVDIHSDKKDASTLQKVYKEYQLPLESLMSADYENLFAIGRCISADFKAQAALRIIPSCFSMGEGLAKYLAKIIGNSVNVF